MTTYHTDPNAGLPAPSDFELEAADRARAAEDGKFTFNQFTREIGLTRWRGVFHRYIKAAGLAGTSQTCADWWTWFGRMLKEQDAIDQAATLADSLT